MKNQQSLISNRYLYSPAEPFYTNSQIKVYKTYDKVTKRDLLLQIQAKQNVFMDNLREYKHAFILYIFDKIFINDDTQVAYIFESGVQENLENAMKKINHFNEEDALVVFKYILMILKQLHTKNLTANQLCLQNILICNYALFKLGYNIILQNLPVQYWSPERHNGQQQTSKSDIYSLGVILYKMLYGQFPFALSENETNKDLAKKIKSKKIKQIQTKSPLPIVISRQVHYLVLSMLDFYEENRPDLETILSNSCFNFQVQTDIQKYIKPKGSIVPQTFHKKYFVYRPSKIVIKYGEYYSQLAYLIFNINTKTFMTMYLPQVRMFEAQPRKVDSYYEKLRAIIKNHKPQGFQHVLKIDDVQRFRQQPIISTFYCNQGNLFSYLQKRKLFKGWLSQSETNVIMYLIAIALKQLKAMGITSMHTISKERIMINNTNIKLRQPGLLSPIIQKKLESNQNIDFFAPELKQKMDFVELDKSDIWSFGVLYIYLLTGEMPKLDEQNHIDLNNLKTNRKNVNLIGKCLDFNVKKRMELENIKMQNIDQKLLHHMLVENHEEIYQNNNFKKIKNQLNEDDEDRNNQNENHRKEEMNHSQLSSNAEELKQNKKIMFKHRKKRIFKHYNKIISQSTTSPCRLIIKAFFGLTILWFVFFALFFVNGGVGLLRTNFYRKITLQVPYNYGTALKNMTILSTNGALIASQYSTKSYEQFTTDLRCAQNLYSSQAHNQLWNFANGSQTIFCLFGFIWAIMLSVLYIIQTYKLDLPTILLRRKEKGGNKQLYHFGLINVLIPSLMFTFFYTFAFEYIVQMTPCFGIQNLAYPTFTSVQSILNGDLGKFFLNVFLTVVLWALLMFTYGFTSFFVKKISNNIFEWFGIIPSASIMLLFTIICRVGFGSNVPIEPTWSYKMNLDITSTYFGLFGFFPEVLWLVVLSGGLLIDFVFWIFLKIGLQPAEEQDIKRVAVIKAKFQRLDTKQNLNQKNNIYLIENAYDFERFD